MSRITPSGSSDDQLQLLSPWADESVNRHVARDVVRRRDHGEQQQ